MNKICRCGYVGGVTDPVGPKALEGKVGKRFIEGRGRYRDAEEKTRNRIAY